MIRRTSLILALALAVGACSDSDDGPRLATIDEVKVVKVSGDQSAPVLGQGIVTVQAPSGGLSLQTVPAGEYTPEPLVGRVEPTFQARGTRGTGPSGLVVPVGTLVHWDIPEEAGRLLGTTTATDDSAYVINRWAPGTKAGTYTVRAQRILGTGEIVTDATWQVVVEPGKFHTFGSDLSYSAHAGDPVDLSAPIQGMHAMDRYYNPIPDSVVIAEVTPTWRILGPRPSPASYQCSENVVDSGTGWEIPAAPAYHPNGYCIEIYHGDSRINVASLRILTSAP